MEVVGRYVIERRIGEGAMADVYRAHDPSIDRVLAIKVLKPEFRQDLGLVGRFLREAKAAGALSHPNIVTIYDVGEADGFPYIAMELLDGVPLDEHLREHGRMAFADAAPDRRPARRRARLCARPRRHPPRHQAVQHHALRRAAGPPRSSTSASPAWREADRGRRRGDRGPDPVRPGARHAALHEPRTGARPRDRPPLRSLFARRGALRADHRPDRLRRHQHRDARPADHPAQARAARRSSPDCPRGLQLIVDKLLAKQPDKRFANGAEVAEALRREQRRSNARQGRPPAACRCRRA